MKKLAIIALLAVPMISSAATVRVINDNASMNTYNDVTQVQDSQGQISIMNDNNVIKVIDASKHHVGLEIRGQADNSIAVKGFGSHILTEGGVKGFVFQGNDIGVYSNDSKEILSFSADHSVTLAIPTIPH